MAALISSVMNTKDRVPFYVNACHELGIEVLPPDVNESQIDFAVVERQDPLRPQRREGRRRARRAARSSAAREEGGPFESIWDFTERVDPSVVEQARARVARQVRRAAGARARGCSQVLEQALACGPEAAGRPARRPGLDLRRPRRRGERLAGTKHHPPIAAEEFEKNELLRLEKETLGLYVSEHPLVGAPRPAAAQDRRDDRRARAAPRRRDRHRRRDRRRGEAADDEARRADGVPARSTTSPAASSASSSTRPTPPRASSASPTGS